VPDAPVAVARPASGGRNTWLVPMLVLVGGMFMSVLDTSIVNVALPTMARDFGVTTDDIEWVATAYTLALGVIVPLSAWVGDRVGLTRAYMACLILFCIASALCGLAWNLESEIVFRIIQAIPGGVLPVVTLPLVYRIVPRESIGSAMGIYGVGILFAPGIGPTLGGYLVEYVDWRLVFFINVPVGIVAALAAYFLLPPTAPSSTRRFDWLGFITIAYGLFALLLAFTEGQSWGWTSYRILILIVSGTLSLALFVIIELEMDEPLVDLRVFRYWPYVNSLLLVSTLSVGLFVVLFYLPLFMQNAQGIAPLKTGVLLLPEALVMMFFMPIAGRLYDLLGPRIPAVVGLVIATYGTWLLCGINPDMSEGEVMLWTSIRAAGNALALMPIMTAGLAAIPPQFASSGSAFNNIAQRVSSSLGLAGLGVFVSNQQSQQLADRTALLPVPSSNPQLQGAAEQGIAGIYPLYQQLQLDVLAQSYSNAFLICTGITAGAIVLAAMLRKPAAESAPSPEPEPAATAPALPQPTPLTRSTATPLESAADAPITEPAPAVQPARAEPAKRPADPEPVRLVKEPGIERLELERATAGRRSSN
jgi:EmrB/QacA subfamily drug resistance transporter